MHVLDGDLGAPRSTAEDQTSIESESGSESGGSRSTTGSCGDTSELSVDRLVARVSCQSAASTISSGAPVPAASITTQKRCVFSERLASLSRGHDLGRVEDATWRDVDESQRRTSDPSEPQRSTQRATHHASALPRRIRRNRGTGTRLASGAALWLTGVHGRQALCGKVEGCALRGCAPPCRQRCSSRYGGAPVRWARTTSLSSVWR